MRKLSVLSIILWFITYSLGFFINVYQSSPASLPYKLNGMLSLLQPFEHLLLIMSFVFLFIGIASYALSLPKESLLNNFLVSFLVSLAILFLTILISLPFVTKGGELTVSSVENAIRFFAIFGGVTLISNLVFIVSKKYQFTGLFLIVYLMLGMFIYYSSNELSVSNAKKTSEKVMCDEKSTLIKAKNCTVVVGNEDKHGSGFIVDPAGYIVTNFHVIKDSDDGYIDVWDLGEVLQGRIVGFDELNDIAIVKIPSSDYVCSWALSFEMDLAETVYAIGWPHDPFGDSTVTRGVFSRLVYFENSPEMIQTDSPINPGNSGGPLVNECGVVGINTSKLNWIRDEAPSEGIGYAISSDFAADVVKLIIAADTSKPVIPPKDIDKYITDDRGYLPSYSTNNEVRYDYEEVLFWEQRLLDDRQVKDGWSDALGSDFVDAEKLSRLLTILNRKVEISEKLWDGYTNSKITYGDVNELKNEYWILGNESADLSRQLNYEGGLNTYNACVEAWENLEKEYEQDFSEQKNECNEHLN